MSLESMLQRGGTNLVMAQLIALLQEQTKWTETQIRELLEGSIDDAFREQKETR